MANNNHNNHNITTTTSYLSLPSKRALMSNHQNHTLSPPKRPKKHQQQPPIPDGHTTLRILCHVSTVSAFIGKSGTAIKQLQQETGSKIRVDDSLLPGSSNRVILIVAPSVPFKTVRLRGEVVYGEEVSAAQEAALRVFEKVLEVSKEDKKCGDTVVVCKVLIDAYQAGFVIGKGGKMVEKLKKDSGAKIRVLLGDQLPTDVSPVDEVVEIEGDVLSVQKGLLGVCGRLQQCPQGDKSNNKDSKPVESTSQPTIRDFHVDPHLQRTQLYANATFATPTIMTRPLSFEIQQSPLYLANVSSSPATLARPSSFEADTLVSIESKSQQEEIVFKVLCSNDSVGGVIGRGGSIVRALQEETGAAIGIGPTVTDCDERVVTITSKEDVDSRYSAAQRAAVLVFTRSFEAAAEKGHETGSKKGSSVSARLLVPTKQVGCLLGKGGAIVSEMRKATGANIRVLRDEQLPKCASEDDKVVEITGPFAKIQDALYQVTSRLRSNFFPSKSTSVPESQTSSSLILDSNLHERIRDEIPIGMHQSFATSQSFDGQYTTRHDLESVLRPQGSDYRSDYSPSARYQKSDVPLGVNSRSFLNLGRGLGPANGRTELGIGLGPANGGTELGRGLGLVNGESELGRSFGLVNGGTEFGSANRPAIVTNTTVEISVPGSAISSVYGENGRNLTRIRQISGARVTVHEALPGSRDFTVVISGTPEETQAAQSLLHAFILTGSS